MVKKSEKEEKENRPFVFFFFNILNVCRTGSRQMSRACHGNFSN